jgi:hypothetical protein
MVSNNLLERQAKHDLTISKLVESLNRNADPSEIALLLADHYRFIARECMEGFTPRPDLRDYWWRFHEGYNALFRKFKKIEDNQ